ncbi:MAG: hypothetical protein HY674_16545 [Chloroflexi bacterium]|nr:hypothetical protein [Chloroflexota bacterium]
MGCSIHLETSGNKIGGVHPDLSHAINAGRCCVGGRNVPAGGGSPRLPTKS